MNTEMENGTQMTFEECMPETFQKPTAGVSDSLARTYPLQESKLDFKETVQACFFRVMYLVGQLKEEDKPTYLFIENVKNLLSVNGGWDFARLLIEMEQWGVRCRMAGAQLQRFRSAAKPGKMFYYRTS